MTTRAVLFLVLLSLLACSPRSTGVPGTERLNSDQRYDEARERKERLYVALGEPPLALPAWGPDQVPREPRLTAFGDAGGLILKAENVGQMDAGEFVVRVGVTSTDIAGTTRSEFFEETWPGVAAGELARSDQFFPPDSQIQVDFRGLERPFDVTISVYVDHPSANLPQGQVLELNEGLMDNFESFAPITVR